MARAAKYLSFLTYFFQICNMNSISRFCTLFVFTPSHHQVSRPNTARVFLFLCDSTAICFLLSFSHFAFSLNPLYSDRSVFPFFAAKVLCHLANQGRATGLSKNLHTSFLSGSISRIKPCTTAMSDTFKQPQKAKQTVGDIRRKN